MNSREIGTTMQVAVAYALMVVNSRELLQQLVGGDPTVRGRWCIQDYKQSYILHQSMFSQWGFYLLNYSAALRNINMSIINISSFCSFSSRYLIPARIRGASSESGLITTLLLYMCKQRTHSV